MEYLSYYTLNKKPFQISTDPKFLWLGNKHQEALSILKYGIEDDKGFLLLTGDVGTGKTTLINAFVNSLEDDIIVARVSDPGLTKLDFIKFVAIKFQMGANFESKSDFLIQFTTLLEQADKDQKKVLLIIDEAQHLTDEVLEEIRLLSNIENQDKKLLNIFLVGQNEFNASLEKYENRALRQRITLNYTLYPLEPEETKTCIEYRLGIAGCQKELFTPEAITAIHTLSEGFPRVINIICDHALFHGCQNQLDKITDEIIWKTSKNLRLSHIPKTFQEPNLDDSTDEDWLEASEVPPLSIEEIYKASQPLPDPEPELGLTEQPKRKTGKYRVAVPIFIIVFLMSGFLVLDENKVESIALYIKNLYTETIASPTTGKTTGQSTDETLKESGKLNAHEKNLEELNSKEVPEEIVHLNDLKKSLPENPEFGVSQNPEEEIASESIDDAEPIEKIQKDFPQPPETETIKPKNYSAKEQKPATPVVEEDSETKIQYSTITKETDIISTEVESTEPEIGEVPPTQPETTVTAPENNGIENHTNETEDPVASSSDMVDQQSQLTVIEIPARDENVVLPEIAEKIETPTVEPTLQPVVPLSELPLPTTEIVVPSETLVTKEETPATTKPEPQVVEQTVTPDPIEKKPSSPVSDTVPKKDQLAPIPDEQVKEPAERKSPPVQEKPVTTEDPGAVIDWLLKSNSN